MQARDTAFFTTAQSEGPSFGTEVKKLGCIPWAKHTLSMAASSVNFRRSTGPCNINAISTVESVDVAFSRLTFAHLVEDAAPLAPVVNAFVGLVASLTGAFIIHSIDKKHDTIALPVGIVCASLFIVRIIIWYFFRSCEATFGAPGVDCKQTCVNFSAAEKDEMKSTFLANTYAIARPGAHVNPEQNAKSWTHAYKTFMCIPAGEDTLTIGDKHIEIYKSSGTCCKKSKESFTIMQSSVKWLHFSSSGRNCVHLFVGLVLGPLWPFWLLYWLGNTSHSMDMSFLGAPPGGGLPGAPSLYNGTWQCVVPTEGVTGETASEDIMFEMLSRKSGKECRKAEPLHSWKGKGGDKASSVLELHDCYILLRKTAKGCCGKTDTYVMLLKDIQHLETFVGAHPLSHFGRWCCSEHRCMIRCEQHASPLRVRAAHRLRHRRCRPEPNDK